MSAGKWLVCKSHGSWVAVEPCSAGCSRPHRPLVWLPLSDDAAVFSTWRQAMDFVGGSIPADLGTGGAQ
jgi:hypothetical protein